MMKRIACLTIVLLAGPAIGAQHGQAEAEVRSAVKAFNGAYLRNDLESYFGNYAADATLYFGGIRRSVTGYRIEWSELIDAGGGVEKNELSDIRVRVLPGGDAAVATYFIDYAMRTADGELAAAKAFETDVWQKVDGKWKVVSLHYSEIPAGE